MSHLSHILATMDNPDFSVFFLTQAALFLPMYFLIKKKKTVMGMKILQTFRKINFIVHEKTNLRNKINWNIRTD